MSPVEPSSEPEPALGISEQDINAALEEFGGDARATIRALLHDLSLLARDHQASVSHGFVRGEIPIVAIPSRR